MQTPRAVDEKQPDLGPCQAALAAGRPRSSLWSLAVLAAISVLVQTCDGSTTSQTGREAVPESSSELASPAPDVFVEATDVGLDFVHFNGMEGERYFVEIMGAGAALFDYDNDGDLDVYIVQGARLGPGIVQGEPTLHPDDGSPLRDRLFRNDLGPEGHLGFTDVTESSGLEARGYGMGVATGDYDDDGWTDLYVTNFGANQLWHNNGDGTFNDVTESSGTDDTAWSVPAAFVDFDHDDLLDLYVGNYTDFRIATHKDCYSPSGQLDWCGPLAYGAVPDRLFHNQGDGTFEDVTRRAGLRASWGRALGVMTADFDGDGWLDIYVANDGDENQLWINRHDGTFENRAVLAGCAVNEQGKAEGSMGVGAADFDGDGDEDLFMTHISRETNTLYVNDGHGQFVDASIATSVGSPSWDFTGFGMSWLDYDNDSDLDLMVVNGAVRIMQSLFQRGDHFPLHQPNALFRNAGQSRFEEVTSHAGSVFELSEVSRGLATGDIDNDGDADVLITNNNGSARLLINRLGERSPWIGLRLVGPSGSDRLGTWVGVERDRGSTLWRRVTTVGSYASASDPRLLFGIGDANVRKVQVRWPDGSAEEWTDLEAGRYQTLRHGKEKPGRAPSDVE